MPAGQPYTVATRGVGRPDYSPEVTPNQGIIGGNQLEWSAYANLNIPALSFTPWTLYTVPTGWNLNILTCIVGCSASCLQRFQIQKIVAGVTTTKGVFTYDMAKEINWQRPFYVPAGGQVFPTFYNLDDFLRTFTITMTGNLELVA